MLVVHWSPVKNTKQILRNGIRKDKRGVFCFPLTGHTAVDRWWAQSFRSWRPRTQYNGFVFRITPEDLPAKFSSWVVDAFGCAQEFNSLPQLEVEFRKTIVWRIGEAHQTEPNADLQELGEELVSKDGTLFSRFVQDPDWMRWVFEDYQIVLSQSIAAKRISRTLSGTQRSGRQRRREFRASTDSDT